MIVVERGCGMGGSGLMRIFSVFGRFTTDVSMPSGLDGSMPAIITRTGDSEVYGSQQGAEPD